jgi:hypothetical protein
MPSPQNQSGSPQGLKPKGSPVLELNNKGRLISLDSNISWESQPVTLSLIELSTVYNPAMRSFSSASQSVSMTHYLSRSAFGDIAKVATLLKGQMFSFAWIDAQAVSVRFKTHKRATGH